MSKYIVTPRQVTETTAPAAEPVTLAQFKTHLRIDHSDEDALLTALIQAAREYVERATGRVLVERTYTAKFHAWADEIVLPYFPLLSVNSVKYYNTASPVTLTTLYDSTSSPLVTSQVFRIDTRGNRIWRAYGETWPDNYIREDSIQIEYKAGFAPTGSPLDYTAPLPESLRSAVLLIAADLYENRESRVIGQGLTPVPNKTFDLLLDQWRVHL